MIPFLCLEKKRSNRNTLLLKSPFMTPHCQPSAVQAPHLAFKLLHYSGPASLSSLIPYRPAWPSYEPWVPSLTKVPYTISFSRSQTSACFRIMEGLLK